MKRELPFYEECPSFDECFCNYCPLDPLAAMHCKLREREIRGPRRFK